MSARLRRAALVAVMLLALAAAACAPSAAQVEAQRRDQCFANQREIKTATNLVHADTGIYPDIADTVGKLHVSCPDGGTYSFDPNTDTVSCSIHGPAPALSNQ